MMRTEVDGFESGNQERRKLIEVAAIETRSAPALLGATHRAFTFYLGNPISSIETRSAPALTHCYLAALPSISEIPFSSIL